MKCRAFDQDSVQIPNVSLLQLPLNYFFSIINFCHTYIIVTQPTLLVQFYANTSALTF